MSGNLYRSGFVRRYHTHPTLGAHGQTNGHHQWGVAALIVALHPNPSRELLMAALFHDAGEYLTGDLPYSFKMFFPKVYEAVSREEEAECADMLGRGLLLEARDRDWLKMCDRLEAVLFVGLVEPARLAEPDWRECVSSVVRMAAGLGVEDEVRGMLA